MKSADVIDTLVFFFPESAREWFEAVGSGDETPDCPPLPQTSKHYQKQFLELFALLYPAFVKTHYYLKTKERSYPLYTKYMNHKKRTEASEERLKKRIITSKSK